MRTPTFGELMKFIMENKKDKTFLNYSEPQIACMVKEALDDNCLYYHQNIDGSISGMILAEISTGSRVLFVMECLSMCLSTLRLFARKAKVQFKGYRLEWMRHGKHKVFNTERVYNKLT